jgi:hypothetical protein
VSQIQVRALGPGYDPLAGNGTANFLTDLDAVRQIIQTRLLLFQGEWFLNLADGTPVFQQMLGVAGAGKRSQIISALLQARIRNSPFVTGVLDVQTDYDPNTRAFGFSCTVSTQFGNITVTTVTPGARAVV